MTQSTVDIAAALGHGDGQVRFHPDSPDTVRIAAVGDLDFHAETFLAMQVYGGPHVFERASPLLAEADVRLANLETVLVRHPYSVLGPRAHLIAGLEAIGGIKAAGFDAVTMANNHTMDGGEAGLAETLTALERAGIACAGAGFDLPQARTPAVLERRGTRLQILAYAFKTGQIATQHAPGCAEARLDHVVADVRAASEDGGVVLVSLHMDAEFQPLPSPRRIAFCRAVVEAGATLVLCHHPHVLQGIERWGTGLIAYSLGNYVTPVSDYMRAYSNESHLSVQLDVSVSSRGVHGFSITPLAIDPIGRPCPLAGGQRERVLELVATRSAHVLDPDTVRRVYRRMTRNYARAFFRSLRWSLTSRDWSRLGLTLSDLGRTPSKRKWLRDSLLH
jgi:poly-gamma-glutamate synthesis protein (capsule biosynthesis protein)